MKTCEFRLLNATLCNPAQITVRHEHNAPPTYTYSRVRIFIYLLSPIPGGPLILNPGGGPWPGMGPGLGLGPPTPPCWPKGGNPGAPGGGNWKFGGKPPGGGKGRPFGRAGGGTPFGGNGGKGMPRPAGGIIGAPGGGAPGMPNGGGGTPRSILANLLFAMLLRTLGYLENLEVEEETQRAHQLLAAASD